MGTVAPFDYASFTATCPEFSYLGSDVVAGFYDMAGEFHANDGTGPVCTLALQRLLMNLMCGHVCKLWAPGPTDQAGNTAPASEVVGRISSATEGSVSVQTQNEYPRGTAQWYQQTKYGSAYYAATQKYRSFMYVAPTRARPSMGLPWQYPNNTSWPF